MRDIILSTGNPSKAKQVQALFEGSIFKILTLADAGIEGGAVEDGETLKENVLKKIDFVHPYKRKPIEFTAALADDTGIFIKHLGGAPGVYSACWAGINTKTEDITRLTLEAMKGAEDRSAIFRTVVAARYYDGKEEPKLFIGEVRGKILEVPRCEPQPKMPYSPIFVPDGHKKSWAEMTTEEENAVSHRGIAFQKARKYLKHMFIHFESGR